MTIKYKKKQVKSWHFWHLKMGKKLKVAMEGRKPQRICSEMKPTPPLTCSPFLRYPETEELEPFYRQA